MSGPAYDGRTTGFRSLVSRGIWSYEAISLDSVMPGWSGDAPDAETAEPGIGTRTRMPTRAVSRGVGSFLSSAHQLAPLGRVFDGGVSTVLNTVAGPDLRVPCLFVLFHCFFSVRADSRLPGDARTGPGPGSGWPVSPGVRTTPTHNNGVEDPPGNCVTGSDPVARPMCGMATSSIASPSVPGP